MQKMIAAALLAAGSVLGAGALAQDYRIEHLEPAFWWSGMHGSRLQLMVHGKRIADLDPTLSYPGVRLAGVTRVANPNYLFLDLELDPDTRPGSFDLRFQRGAKQVHYRYQLLARAPQSAQRASFSGADVIYELMPDRFANGNPANDNVAGMPDRHKREDGSGRHGGDLQGMLDHLDYVAEQGYTMVWPTPLLESNTQAYSYHGYAATDYYKIDPRYGSNEDFRNYVAQARKRGIGVIQDVVLNHIGKRHWWMSDLPTPDWNNYGGQLVITDHHRVALQDPYASAQDKRNYTGGWFSDSMPDLNQRNPLLANYLIQNTIWWIEYAGLAGLRVDTYSYSDPAFLSEWSGRMRAEYPHLNMVGEEWSPLVPVVARWQEGKQNFDGYVSHMPSMMDFPLADSLRRALSAADGDEYGLNNLYETLSQDHLYSNAANLVMIESNHDLARSFSVLNEDDDLFRMGLAYVLTVPRIPQLYSGMEIQMTSTVKGRDDPAYRRDFPGGWAGDKVNAFTGQGLSAQQLAAQAYVKKLLNWRKSQTVIHSGKTMHFGPEQNSYVYFRYNDSQKIMVVLNKNKTTTVLATARFAEMLGGVGSGVDVATGKTYTLKDTLTVPARSALILELKP
ncbi:glycoside hydrolase family 13 protein [Oxalobacteraceae bacterium]|nr:glycoside hydrolase family 13 protein [Oxalobacteraceae bacterium]